MSSDDEPEPNQDDYEAYLAAEAEKAKELEQRKSKDVLGKNPLEQGRLKAWLHRNKKPNASIHEIDVALEELLEDAFADLTFDGAVQMLQRTSEEDVQTEGPTSILAASIDFEKLKQKEQIMDEVAARYADVKLELEEMRRSGFLTAEKEREILGLEAQKTARLPSKQKQALEDQINKLEAQRDKFRAAAANSAIPKPMWKIGDKARYANMEVEVIDMNFEDKRWVYDVKNTMGSEFEAIDRELSPLPAAAPVVEIVRIIEPPKPAPPPVVTPVVEIPVPPGRRLAKLSIAELDDLTNTFTSYLVEHGYSKEQALELGSRSRNEIESEAKNARNIDEARSLIQQLAGDVARANPVMSRGTTTQEIGRATGAGGGNINIPMRSFTSDTLSARIEAERGTLLTPIERALLQLPLFQKVEKNAQWFSKPKEREKKGYPLNEKDLIAYYYNEGDVSAADLRSIGIHI